jgi:peptidoglycan/xylan/chitin deacetylase (PgdA/CDA1 family)
LVAKFRLPSTLYLCTQHFEEGWSVVEVAVRYTIWRFECRPVRITGFGEEVDGIYQTEIPQVRSTMCDGIIKWISQNAHTREQVCTALERFAACGGITAPQLALDTRRFDFMTRDELLATQRQGCSIELHGHVHRYPEGDPSALKRDLQRCSATIVKTDLPRPTHYCYPSGTFDFGSASILEELGIRSATTCLPGLINTVSGPSCFFLPRFLDGETVSDIEFEAELSGFAEFFRRLAGRGQTRRPLAPT